jgi:hypothetical protein
LIIDITPPAQVFLLGRPLLCFYVPRLERFSVCWAGRRPRLPFPFLGSNVSPFVALIAILRASAFTFLVLNVSSFVAPAASRASTSTFLGVNVSPLFALFARVADAALSSIIER